MKEAYPAVPWHEINGFRNIIVHNYLGDIDALTTNWVVCEHLDPLEKSVNEMLSLFE